MKPEIDETDDGGTLYTYEVGRRELLIARSAMGRVYYCKDVDSRIVDTGIVESIGQLLGLRRWVGSTEP